jgi:hypothetical protein
MIIISHSIYKILDEYTNYLVQEGLTSQARADEKIDQILQAVYSNLNGIVTHRPSPYKELGKDESCLLYVYKDSKSKTQWGFAYRRFNKNNIIVYYMKNLKLIRENKEQSTVRYYQK